ncbi:MAG TPA: ankyrin repeat domain-containing protein [Dyella sp.]|uniref:ankyrin repeat domain-containing protein n=1 Tax=Dyella sp. TaxID=1869338 RepID=UPI002CE4B276|nr:ankyrin repeat domain-containing protein [Dyella sp.]HTV84224.1 ankyrin repeat domain-containing protein [Dyella sp.]
MTLSHPDDVRALHDAAFHPNTARLAALLADPDLPRDTIRPTHNTTPLMEAARIGHLSAVSLLLAHGADPRVTNTNGTDAQAMAARFATSKHLACVEILHDARRAWDKRDLQEVVQGAPMHGDAARRVM